MKIRISSVLVCASIICFIISGCGGTSYIPVSGTVTVDGKPMEGVTLSFLPEAGGTNASGTTSPVGTFTVRTSDKNGCLPGTYVVTIAKYEQKPAKMPANRTVAGPIPNDNPITNRLPDKYAKKETSGFKVTVERNMKPLEFSITTK